MEINTDISLQGIIVAQIPVEEKLMLINRLRDILQERYDVIAKVLENQTNQEMLMLEGDISVLDGLIADYTGYLNNN